MQPFMRLWGSRRCAACASKLLVLCSVCNHNLAENIPVQALFVDQHRVLKVSRILLRDISHNDDHNICGLQG